VVQIRLKKRQNYSQTYVPGQGPLLADTIDCLDAQLYNGWGLTVISDAPCPDPVFEDLEMLEWIMEKDDLSGALHRATEGSQADWVALIEAGDRFEPHLLFSCVDYINLHPEWRLIYTDEDSIDSEGNRFDPKFKPDFNLDLLRSTPYMGSFCLVRRDSLLKAGGFNWLAEVGNYEVVFRVLEECGEDAIGHVSEMLYHRLKANEQRYDRESLEEQGGQVLIEHLKRCGIDASVTHGLLSMSYLVEYRHTETPLVSIIIPTKDQIHYLKPCVDSLLKKTNYPNYEVIVIDNNTSDIEALEYLAMLERDRERVRVLRYPHPYNYSAINNMAVREAKGDYLLLLNNDTNIVQNSWLDRMMAHGQRPDVGVVGARLVFGNQRIQHAGVILGMGANGVAEHPFLGLPMSELIHGKAWHAATLNVCGKIISHVIWAYSFEAFDKISIVNKFDNKVLEINRKDIDKYRKRSVKIE